MAFRRGRGRRTGRRGRARRGFVKRGRKFSMKKRRVRPLRIGYRM